MTDETAPLTLDLIEALMLMKTPEEIKNFLKDLCTPQELSTLHERWRVCQLLETKLYSYRDIHRLTGASLTTISRVARFLKDEPYQGYRTLLEKINRTKDNLDSGKTL